MIDAAAKHRARTRVATRRQALYANMANLDAYMCSSSGSTAHDAAWCAGCLLLRPPAWALTPRPPPGRRWEDFVALLVVMHVLALPCEATLPRRGPRAGPVDTFMTAPLWAGLPLSMRT